MKSTNFLISLGLLSLRPEQVSAFWRMACSVSQTARADPILNPGTIAGHVHKFAGGNNVNQNSTYDTLQASTCSSCEVQDDKSAYWTPQLYYAHSNGSVEEVQNDGMTVYYVGRGGNASNTKPFPPGFKMISGISVMRSYDNQTLTYQNTRPVADRVSFRCIDEANDIPEQHHLFDTNCVNGMRAQINFQSCWDGQNLYLPNSSHVAYLSGIDYGDCPPTHPVPIPGLFFEVLYWTNRVDQSAGGQFVFSNGDTTGYGFHGDFMNGWNMDVQTAAVENCLYADNNGVVSACPALATSDNVNFPRICPQQPSVFGEPVHGMLDALPGCNPITSSPGISPQIVCPLNSHNPAQALSAPSIEAATSMSSSSSAFATMTSSTPISSSKMALATASSSTGSSSAAVSFTTPTTFQASGGIFVEVTTNSTISMVNTSTTSPTPSTTITSAVPTTVLSTISPGMVVTITITDFVTITVTPQPAATQTNAVVLSTRAASIVGPVANAVAPGVATITITVPEATYTQGDNTVTVPGTTITRVGGLGPVSDGFFQSPNATATDFENNLSQQSAVSTLVVPAITITQAGNTITIPGRTATRFANSFTGTGSAFSTFVSGQLFNSASMSEGTSTATMFTTTTSYVTVYPTSTRTLGSAIGSASFTTMTSVLASALSSSTSDPPPTTTAAITTDSASPSTFVTVTSFLDASAACSMYAAFTIDGCPPPSATAKRLRGREWRA